MFRGLKEQETFDYLGLGLGLGLLEQQQREKRVGSRELGRGGGVWRGGFPFHCPSNWTTAPPLDPSRLQSERLPSESRESRVESPGATYRVRYSQYVLFVLHSPSLFVRPLVVATVSALLRNPHHVTRIAAASFPNSPVQDHQES